MGSIFSSNNLIVSPVTENSSQELFVEIFSFLEPIDVESCSLVCHNWTKIINACFRPTIRENYQILEIFKFLSRNDLDGCQLVSKNWNGVVSKHNGQISLRPIYYTIEQKRENNVHVDSVCDFTEDKTISTERIKEADLVRALKNCFIANATINFRRQPIPIREHFLLNKISSSQELALFYDSQIDPIESIENGLIHNIENLNFRKFWCSFWLNPEEDILIHGQTFNIPSLKNASEVLIYWEKVNLVNFEYLLDFLFLPTASIKNRREKCDIIIKNIGLMIDYFVERFLHDEELDIDGMFEEMEFTGSWEFFPEFYRRTSFENPSNFRNGKAILRIWMESCYDAERVTLNAVAFEEKIRT